MTYDDRWHDKKFCGQPDDGYTNWIANIIGDCPVELGVDFFTLDWRKYAHRLVYAGAIDRMFEYSLGRLEYRTLRFEEKLLDGNYQGVAQMNYTDGGVPHTRITEHKHFNYKNQEKTVVTWEYPAEWKEGAMPYYPIGDDKNRAIYGEYKKLVDGDNKLIVGGRLGSYLYMDMDQVIGAALKKAEESLK